MLPVDGWLLAGWVAAGWQDCSWLADRGWLAGWPIPLEVGGNYVVWPIPLEVGGNYLVPGPYYSILQDGYRIQDSIYRIQDTGIQGYKDEGMHITLAACWPWQAGAGG